MTNSGLEIVGTLYRPTDSEPPWPGVLLLHMIYAQRQDWADFAKYLAQNGLVALAIDLRGHGETGGEMEWDLARQDLNQVWKAFGEIPEVDPNKIAIIGASMGANMAVLLGADQPGVRALALLSPGVNYYQVLTPKPLAEYGERPVLIIASQEDSYAASSAEELLKYARGEARLEMLSGVGHGTQMLTNQPDLTALILEWLRPFLQ
jgi:dienelactone hydrolase